MKQSFSSIIFISTIALFISCSGSGEGDDVVTNDHGAPGISSVFPADTSTNIPIKARVRIVFNTGMDETTITTANIQLQTGGSDVAGQIQYYPKSRTALLTPDGDLVPGTSYSVTVSSSVKTALNESIEAKTWQFTTEKVGMPIPNYRLGIIHTGAQITLSTYTPGADIEIGTSSNTGAAEPDSWSSGTTYIFSSSGTVKFFARAKKDGDYSAVFSRVYIVQDTYPPAAGQSGSDAVHMDDTSFLSWANGHVNYLPGSDVDATWQTPEKAYGKAVGTSYDIVCLGNAVYTGGDITGGMITMTFPNGIGDGTGNDFAVFENSFSDTFLELSYVEVSSDGEHFARFDKVSLIGSPVGAFGSVDAGRIYGFAGRYRQGYGTPFDLGDLRYNDEVRFGLVDLSNIRYVKIIDVLSGNATEPDPFMDLDSFGNRIYDPYKCTGSGGFDLEAVGVINEAE
jgi:hypothetical protein